MNYTLLLITVYSVIYCIYNSYQVILHEVIKISKFMKSQILTLEDCDYIIKYICKMMISININLIVCTEKSR